MGRAHLFACSIGLAIVTASDAFAADRVTFRTGTGLAAPADVPVMKPRQIALCLRVERRTNDEWHLMEGYAKSIASNRLWLDGEKQRVDRAAMTVNTLDPESVEKQNAAVAYLGQRVDNHNVAVRDYNARKAMLDQAVAEFNKACTRPYLEDEYQAVAAELARLSKEAP